MLPKGHQSHQLVCRNLGESDKSLPAGTGTPRFGRDPHGTVPPAPQTRPCGTAVPSTALTPQPRALGRGRAALPGLCLDCAATRGSPASALQRATSGRGRRAEAAALH